RVTHIHHIRWWENGGETNIDNGVPRAPPTTTSSTKAAGPSPGTPTPAPPACKAPTARSSKPKSTSGGRREPLGTSASSGRGEHFGDGHGVGRADLLVGARARFT